MSQKGKGEKPPTPTPPRRVRVSTPPAVTPSDVTSASGPPSAPTAARRSFRGVEPIPEVEPTTTSGRASPPFKGSPPKITLRDSGAEAPGRVTPDSGPLSSRRASISDAGPSAISSRVTRTVSPLQTAPGAKAPQPRVTIRDPGKSVPDSGPSSSPVTASKTVSPPKASTRDAGLPTTPRTGTTDSVAATTTPPALPSTRASSVEARPLERMSSLRVPLPSSSSQKTTTTTGGKGPSPRITFQEAGPSTSTRSVKMAAAEAAGSKESSTKHRWNVFRKNKPETAQTPATTTTPSPARRRVSTTTHGTSSGGRAKTNRILYTTDEEVRDALVEFSVFIIFLVLTSLVTLSVRHSYMFYFNDTMKKLFTTRELVIAPSVTVCFEKLITVPDWWDYLVYNFLTTLHGDLTFLDGNDTRPGEPPEAKPPAGPPGGPGAGPPGGPGAGPPGGPPAVPQAGRRANKPERLVKKSAEENAALKKLLDQSPYNWDPGVDWVPGARVIRQDGSPSPEEDELKAGPPPEDKGPYINTQNFTSHLLEGRIFLYENLLLGPPRLRQIRVRKESCYVNDAFIRYFNTCYAAYTNSAEERKAKFHGTSYQTMTDLDTTPLWTVLAFYRSGGYVMDLTYEKEKNLELITKLKNEHWLDRGSRLCLVEFNLFNENTDIFQSVKLIAEIPPTGGVIPQAHLQTVKRYSFFSDRSMVMTVIYIFWYIMIVHYTIFEIHEMRKSGCKNYFFSMLNILDCIILLLCYLALVYNVWHTFKVASVTTKAMKEFSYQSLDVLCFWNIIYVDMMAILAFLVWIKIFKFISFNKTLVQFTTTLKRCSKDLAGFSLMFGIVFLAYAQLGLLLFGTKHPDFRNFITSILTMIRMILGDFQYNLIEQANRVLGPIYFLTYILLVFFILLNMFLAIIMETYNTVKGEITQGRSQLGSYIYKKLTGLLYVITHCGRKRRVQTQQTTEEAEEAKSAHEEPEEVRKNMTPAEARYFQEIPPVDNKEFVRLNNRVGLLEEILEKLITNMDDILKRVEKEKKKK